MQDVDGSALPLRWGGAAGAAPVAAGTRVVVRFYFRAAVIYSFGVSPPKAAAVATPSAALPLQ